MTEQGDLRDTFKMAHGLASVAQRTPKTAAVPVLVQDG